MSRAFVTVTAEGRRRPVSLSQLRRGKPERMVSSGPNLVTEGGTAEMRSHSHPED